MTVPPRQLDLVNDTTLKADYAPVAVHSGLSTDAHIDPVASKHTASSTDYSDISEIERLRQVRGLSHARLCAVAGVELNNWHKLRRRNHAPTVATLRKLAAALADPVPSRPPKVIAAFHRVCVGLAADALGLDRAAVLGTDFSVTRRTETWLAAARARMIAVYVTAVELEVDNSELARALGITRQAVKKARDKVEDLRDAAAIDAAIEAVTQQVRG